MVFWISKQQAGGLAEWRPAQWIPGIRDFHRAQLLWQLGCDHSVLMSRIPSVLRRAGFVVYSRDANVITAGRLSPTLQFLHHVTFRVVQWKPTTCKLEATCVSTSACPAWFPLALLFSIPLCWVPFPDCGENRQILMLLKSQLLIQNAHANYGILFIDEEIRASGSDILKGCDEMLPASLVFFVMFIVCPALIVGLILTMGGIARV
mmetsp:Transcript_5233/g.7698  ORF Transcript_5233/g.7698 Transcript_5233/m.7698 type:complete len:206 (+) Transcript_5233:114-731(+)